ncbi:MAG: PDDEXK nuclease domain-containing protein [Bacteroidota bacterium]|nr:PDDEXK nuclease domain-containing protein [Bacteroidota bacterium]
MNLEQQFAEIIAIIKQARSNAYKAVNTELINHYWNIGSYIHIKLANAQWGEKTVEELASFIEKKHPELKGYNRRGLYRMKQFYETYASSAIVSPLVTQLQMTEKQGDEIVSPVVTQLEISDIKKSILTQISWSHHLIIISKAKLAEEREFYIRLCIKERYGKRELERQINSGVFERVISGNLKLSTVLREIYPNIEDTFKDTYVFEFVNLPDPHYESDLQKGLIKQMKNFILELGKDFLFVGEEYRLQVGNKDFFSDLVFYHRGLQCLVAFELKTTEFEPEHLGKLNFYLEALDRDVKKPHENPSIGVLLCKNKNEEVVEYAMSRNLSPTLISQYTIALPDKKLLQAKLHELYELYESKEDAE